MSTRYLRTDKDFVIDSIAGLKDIVNRHTVAGFKDIPDGIMFRRFYQLIKFLQDNRLVTRTLCNYQSEVDYKSELKNSDINNKGFYFLQYALPKWEDRLYKDQGEEKEWKYLEKWYQTFLDKIPILPTTDKTYGLTLCSLPVVVAFIKKLSHSSRKKFLT